MRLKEWMMERFLPVWCREEMRRQNERLARRLEQAQGENRRLRAYIDGMHRALKSQRRIVIHKGEVRE